MGTIGKALQILGLVILPTAVVLELLGRLGRNGLSEMLLMMIFGAAAFGLGRFVEGYARQQ